MKKRFEDIQKGVFEIILWLCEKLAAVIAWIVSLLLRLKL